MQAQEVEDVQKCLKNKKGQGQSEPGKHFDCFIAWGRCQECLILSNIELAAPRCVAPCAMRALPCFDTQNKP